MQVVVVILTYAPPAGALEAAVDSVLNDIVRAGIGEVNTELVVVDNGDRAGRALEGRSPLTLLRTQSNRGYGPGMNVGIEWALDRGADVVVVLNDDLTVGAGWLRPLLAAFEHSPRVGAVQPTLLIAGTDPPLVNSRGVRMDSYGAGTDLGLGEPYDIHRARKEIEVFTGGAVAFSRGYLDDVGHFDERFFLYYEDVELARRGKRRGWTYLCVPDSTVSHVGSASASELGDRQRFYQERNRLWCVAMTGTPGEMLRAVWLSVRRLRHRPLRTHWHALGSGVAGGVIRLAQRASTRTPNTGAVNVPDR